MAFGGWKKIKDGTAPPKSHNHTAVPKWIPPYKPAKYTPPHVSFPESSPAFKEYERSRGLDKKAIPLEKLTNWGIQESNRPKFSGPIQPKWRATPT
jgi:hypothetical protein